MRRFAYLMTALAASTLGTAAVAAPIIINPTAPTDKTSIGAADGTGTTSSGSRITTTTCGGAQSCAFTSQFSFTSPAGYDLASVTLSTNYSDSNLNENIDFTGGSLNGSTLTLLNSGGQSEFAFVNNVPLLSGTNANTLTVTGNAGPGSEALPLNAAFSGVFTFAQRSPTVPEPATWAMMLVGFGAAGYSLRRKRSVHAMQAA